MLVTERSRLFEQHTCPFAKDATRERSILSLGSLVVQIIVITLKAYGSTMNTVRSKLSTNVFAVQYCNLESTLSGLYRGPQCKRARPSLGNIAVLGWFWVSCRLGLVDCVCTRCAVNWVEDSRNNDSKKQETTKNAGWRELGPIARESG